MDPAIAAAAVALIGPYLAKAGGAFAGKAGEAAWQLAGRLYQAIQRKIATDNDGYAEATLRRLQEQPESKDRQEALAALLREKGQQDPAFAREVQQIVQVAVQDNSVNQVMMQVSGNAWVDNVITIAPGHVGRDQHIYLGGDNEGLRLFARAPGAVKALIVTGLALTFIGFATFGSFIVRGILSDGVEGPDPMPAVPLGLGLFFAGLVVMTIGQVWAAVHRR